ncbi:hypothetical protein AAGT10_15000 (plasmid) [Sulfolobus tengchongensis]|uniref:Uncharacterized protein n=1 Tax=Sulfolobus tengchongensis TaxID=207809 RepID=A0AAX4L5B4_9CREN
MSFVFFRSLRIVEIFEILLRNKFAYAKELADAIGVESKNIYPRLKRYFGKFITVVKEGKRNKYVLREDVIENIKKAIRYSKDEGKIIRRAEELMQEMYGMELNDVDREIIRYLVRYMKKLDKAYLEGGLEGNIAEILSRALKIPVDEIAASLVKLGRAGILYLYPSINAAYKVRLSKKLL